MKKIDELLHKIKYHDGQSLKWDEIAQQLDMSVETLHKLRKNGLYDSLRWGQVQKLASLLNMKPSELVKTVEESE